MTAELNAAVSVSRLNEYIKKYLDNAAPLKNIAVKGEISNMKLYPSGHIYFTLKDEQSCLKAVMFGGASKLKFKPADGMKVICTGKVSVYVRDGTYQLYAENIEPDGLGSLYLAFEQLKQKLGGEGLFDAGNKKKLPKIPFRIGIITAPSGAAVRDMINVLGRRFPAAEIIIYPSLVQGENAPAQLIKGLRYLDANMMADIIIIGRGGGSIEDLWAFNDEKLARAIYACHTPVISAVGHETDFTIADFVADLRAPTPSAAAELAVPDSGELKIKFSNARNRMISLINATLENRRKYVSMLENRPSLKNPLLIFNEKRMRLTHLEDKLYSSLNFGVKKAETVYLNEKLSGTIKTIIQRNIKKLEISGGKLQALNPMSVLERGYAAAFKNDGSVLKSEKDLTAGEAFRLVVKDGEINAVRR